MPDTKLGHGNIHLSYTYLRIPILEVLAVQVRDTDKYNNLKR